MPCSSSDQIAVLVGPVVLGSTAYIKNSQGLFKCPFDVCAKSYTSRRNLKEHIEYFHSNKEKPFACTQCDRKFTRQAMLAAHFREVHEKVKPHQCDQCGKTFGRNTNLRRHTETVHSNGRPHMFKCPVRDCSYGPYKTKDALNKHLHSGHHHQSDSGASRNQCDQCSASFATVKGLTAHKRTHSRERPFQCTNCNKSFKTSDVFKRHKQYSACLQPRKRYACALCDRQFHRLCVLKRHNRNVHLKLKPHVCPECGRTFARLDTLKGHIRICK